MGKSYAAWGGRRVGTGLHSARYATASTATNQTRVQQSKMGAHALEHAAVGPAVRRARQWAQGRWEAAAYSVPRQ